MTEVRLPAPVKATPTKNIDAMKKPGAFELVTGYKVTPEGRKALRGKGEIKGMFYRCPCGCGVIGYLAIRPAVPEHPSWGWNGDRKRPTLEPSVNHVGHWHGWLKDGMWTQA